jgi:hypothetical protein
MCVRVRVRAWGEGVREATINLAFAGLTTTVHIQYTTFSFSLHVFLNMLHIQKALWALLITLFTT